MDEQSLAGRIERELAQQAGLDGVAVEVAGDVITLSGRIDSDEARQAAHDIVKGLAPEVRIDDNLEVEVMLPLDVRGFDLDEPGSAALPPNMMDVVLPSGEHDLAPPEPGTGGDLPESLDEVTPQSDVEPDFTEQPLMTSPVDMLGEASTEIEAPEESENVYFAPTDPVITIDDRNEAQVLGGFSPTAMDEITVEPSALDDQPGDEALADAIRGALRQDAATTDLQIHVSVRRGVARLRGTVPSLDDAENAEAVAGQVPGVEEVIEELDAEGL